QVYNVNNSKKFVFYNSFILALLSAFDEKLIDDRKMKSRIRVSSNRINNHNLKLLTMKKEIVLIALVFSFFGSYAQNYVPFPETDVEWIMNVHKEGQFMK